jgi:Bacterial Ig-like domain (group 1)
LGRRGVATVTATTPLGISGASRVVFVPAAARVVVISGDGQTGVAGSALAHPVVVEVQAADNLPVPGAKVTFRAVTLGGQVHDTTATADSAGRATTTLTLGNSAGAYRYEVGSESLAPASVAAVATPAPPFALGIVSGDAQMDFVGRALGQPLVVKVTDKFGGPVEGATIVWTTIAGSGTPGATSTVSSSDGTSSITYTLGSFASSDLVRATMVGVNATTRPVLFSMTGVNPGVAAIAIVSGGNQSAPANTSLPLPLVARATDALARPFANATVTWSAKTAGVTFNPASSATDATGQVTTRVTVGAATGLTTITATVAGFSAQTSLTITATVGSPTLSIYAGDQQSARAGTSVVVAPSVSLKDAFGNPVANAPVAFSVTSGGGSVREATRKTNAAGIATIGMWTLGSLPGTNTLSATSGALSVSFSATGLAAEAPHEPKEGGAKP